MSVGNVGAAGVGGGNFGIGQAQLDGRINNRNDPAAQKLQKLEQALQSGDENAIQKATQDLVEEAKRNPKGVQAALQANPQMSNVLAQGLASSNLGQGSGGVATG
jgi:hypothetical protein